MHRVVWTNFEVMPSFFRNIILSIQIVCKKSAALTVIFLLLFLFNVTKNVFL
ncbi:hypothetical protein Cycma_4189 [Cyclobacterium marinum DSM 745]|uniref:Uncharacterized protein n=1 Tax=Cyclobacterium marinum (strain ATCC 25205 / DSM 745 / LMG 13164 / NCIMB 1802) TaxID=880070 RepID=G0IV94_CYCMS|nr:hypothetical protein Cycma_4189 [Cyclobacterium marinum DSM 745]